MQADVNNNDFVTIMESLYDEEEEEADDESAG